MGGLGQVLGLLDPSEHTQSVCSTLPLQDSQGTGGLSPLPKQRGPCCTISLHLSRSLPISHMDSLLTCLPAAFSTSRAMQTTICNNQSCLLNIGRTKGTEEGPDSSPKLLLRLPPQAPPARINPCFGFMKFSSTQQGRKLHRGKQNCREQWWGCLIKSCQLVSAILLYPVPCKPLPNFPAVDQECRDSWRQRYQQDEITTGKPNHPAETFPLL